MTEELKQAFEVLAKYEYEGRVGYWYPLTSIERYENSNIRLKPLRLKPLTVEEAKKLTRVFTPYINTAVEPSYKGYEGVSKIKAIAEGLAYATAEEATRHAQAWLNSAKEKAGL